ncbi:cytosine deaminase [Halococcus salsus]|uniref:cytosine deaminase n=1 Tax=Halococcus salsus TaxID=2162894 RepID=UPI001358FB29|nr:cytosine deaminase [Halococcus salsus]
MARYLVQNAQLLDGDVVDIEIEDSDVASLNPAGSSDPESYSSDNQYDAEERLVTPSLTEPHLHLDATQTAGGPRWNRSGTLTEGIEIWGERKQSITKQDVKDRALKTIKWLVSHGTTRIRTHADTTEETLTGVEALCELREEVADLVDLQVVAFPQDGILTDESHEDLLRDAIDVGVDLIGGIPHRELTPEDGAASVKIAADLAERHELPVDLHIDETDDPNSRFTEVLASEALKRDIGDRVTASHATAMHSYSNAHAQKVISMLSESGVSVITNPLANIVLQGRYDDYPRRRGHTRVDELRAAGVTIGIGHDSVLDPFYHYGTGDQLDAAFMLIHYLHMNGYQDVADVWEMLTTENATVFSDDDYGLEPGSDGSLVVYDAMSPFDALRTRAPRTLVLRSGHEVARTEPQQTTVRHAGDSERIRYRR